MYKEIGQVFMLMQACKVKSEIFDVVCQGDAVANRAMRIRRK